MHILPGKALHDSRDFGTLYMSSSAFGTNDAPTFTSPGWALDKPTMPVSVYSRWSCDRSLENSQSLDLAAESERTVGAARNQFCDL